MDKKEEEEEEKEDSSLKCATAPSSPPPPEFPPRHAVATLPSSSWYGTHSLLRHVSLYEMDTLIGWATHIDRPDHVRQPKHLDAVPSLSHNNPHNPLRVGLKDEASLPPSLLQSYLQEKFVQVLEKRIEQETADAVSPPASVVTHQPSCDASDPDASRDHLTASTLSSYSVLWESLDISALVALGMIAEEMVTALLLPLAACHVQHCRRMEEQEASERKDDDGGGDDDVKNNNYSNDEDEEEEEDDNNNSSKDDSSRENGSHDNGDRQSDTNKNKKMKKKKMTKKSAAGTKSKKRNKNFQKDDDDDDSPDQDDHGSDKNGNRRTRKKRKSASSLPAKNESNDDLQQRQPPPQRRAQDSDLRWTLPPHEALHRIMVAAVPPKDRNKQTGNRDAAYGLVSSLPATRRIAPAEDVPAPPSASEAADTTLAAAATIADTATNELESEMTTTPMHQSLQTWLTRHQLDQVFVQSNPELFQWLLPQAFFGSPDDSNSQPSEL